MPTGDLFGFSDEFRRFIEQMNERRFKDIAAFTELLGPYAELQEQIQRMAMPQMESIRLMQEEMASSQAAQLQSTVREILANSIDPDALEALKSFAAEHARFTDALRLRADIEDLFDHAEAEAKDLGDESTQEAVAESRLSFYKLWIVIESLFATPRSAGLIALALTLAGLGLQLLSFAQTHSQTQAIGDCAEAILRLSAILEQLVEDTDA